MSEAGGIQEAEKALPPPPQDEDDVTADAGCRLWIGNLDTRLTEFNLLKLLQKYGTLEKFDYIIHKTGPDAGKPRGYCFATYSSVQEAEKAKRALDGKLALSKHLVVRNANADRKDEFLTRFTVRGPTTSKKTDKSSTSKDATIRAIEAKLRLMEKTEDKPILAGPVEDHRHHSNNHAGSGIYQSHAKGPGPSHQRSKGHGSHGNRSQPYSRAANR